MKVIRWIDKYAEATVISIGLVAIVAVMTAQIAYRKIFGQSIIWSEELCRHIFICVACWGLAYSIRIRNAIKFDMLVTFFPKKAKYLFEIFSNIIVMVFFAYMFLPSLRVSVTMKSVTATALPYSMDLIHYIALIGFVLAGFRALEMTIIDICSLVKEKGKNGEEADK